MSHALANLSPTARRRSRSDPGLSSHDVVNTTLRDQQQKEFPHLPIASIEISRPTSIPPPPNFSIVPSTIDLEGSWVKPYLDTFPQFPNLPVELRIKIYKFACLEPRVVPIWPVIMDRTIDTVKFQFASETPAILQVSHEAREESKKFDIYTPSRAKWPQPRIWIKPSLDIICPVRNNGAQWSYAQFSVFASRVVGMKIERLALDNFASPEYTSTIDMDDWDDFSNFPEWMSQNLREIFLYTSTKKFNIRHHPLKLVDYTGEVAELEYYPDPSYVTNGFVETEIHLDRKFGRLRHMLEDLQIYREVQEEIDRIREMTGKQREQVAVIPAWLYKHLKTWNPPKLTRSSVSWT
ncbi:hypothetical protein NHQ30_007609 [Ciborinia camelliae]|nr:hypothetical protein NHQ30_007609 [Ciborinia camelliae]